MTTDETWIIDLTTGQLTIEGATGLDPALGPGVPVNCGRPVQTVPLPHPLSRLRRWLARLRGRDTTPVRVHALYHGSVTEGPGRRSVVQLQGCPIRCAGCYVPETHEPAAGTELAVYQVVERLLEPAGAPRDGVTILGGEPFAQPAALHALLMALRPVTPSIVVYTGYTIEALWRRRDPRIQACLALIDLLIDGPFIAAQAEAAGEWRGSRNQRRILVPRWLEAQEG